MIIKTLSGKTIASTPHKTMRAALEHCIENDIVLAYADLRKSRLRRACLDGLKAPKSCFWGSDFDEADMGYADLRGADMRNTSFKDSCLCGSDLSDADLRGAFFSGTMFEDAKLDDMKVSCPSIWTCSLQDAKKFQSFDYIHCGEASISVTSVPSVFEGPGIKIVHLGDAVLWNGQLYSWNDLLAPVQKALFILKTASQMAVQSASPQNAMAYIPKTSRFSILR